MQTLTYAPSDEDFANPERGWFSSIEPNFLTNQTTPLDAGELEAWGASNDATLVKQNTNMNDFLDADLSNEFLEAFEADMRAAEEAGFKVVVHFTYNWNPEISDEDASLERTLAHIEQLAPLLEEHEHVIDHVQGGFIGFWGEGHTSSNEHVLPRTVQLSESGEAIFGALAAAMPDDITLTLRYPDQIGQLIDAPVVQEEATDGAGGAIIGYNNDGLFYDETHFGSFDLDEESREEQIAYLGEVTEHTATSGEPGGDDGSGFFREEDASDFLDGLNYTSLSLEQGDAEAAGVYDHWRETGEFGEISRGLGYRFELEEARLPEAVAEGSEFVMEFDVENVGFARAHGERPVEVVFRGGDGRAFAIDTGVDARDWDDGEVTTVAIGFDLPDEMTAGDYEVLLNLPDPSEELEDDARYSIRLANEGAWEEETGFNALGATVRVGADEGDGAPTDPAPVKPEPGTAEGVRGFAFDATETGMAAVAAFDLDSSGRERTYDVLEITLGDGATLSASTDAEMLRLVATVQASQIDGVEARTSDGDLVLSSEAGGVLVLEDLAAQLDAQALTASLQGQDAPLA